MIKQSEAKKKIYSKWKRWLRDHPGKTEPDGNDAFLFYLELEGREDPALDFRCKGDKWQTVHAWLLNRRLVKD